MRRFILLHRKRHPADMGAAEIEAFLTHPEGLQVELPDALERKYPQAHLEWSWQRVLPAKCPSHDPRSGTWRRHHAYPETVQCQVKDAVKAGGA